MSTNPFLVLLLLLVPLTVRVRGILPPHDLLWRFPNYPIEADLFTYWKGRVLFLLAFLAMTFWPRHQHQPTKVVACILVFLTGLLISTLWSDYPYLCMYGAPNYNEGALCWLAYTTIFLIAADIPDETFRRIMRWSVFTMAVFPVLQIFIENPFMLPGIHQLMSPETITTVRTSQVYGTLGNPNHLGLYCAMMLPLFCQELSLAPLLTTVMLVASGSRLGVVGAFAGCTYIVLKKSPRLLWMVVPSFIALFAYLVHTHHMDVGRWYIWKVSLAATWKHVLIGAGPSTLLNYIPQGEPGIYSNAIIDRPHNLYLQVWHAAGLPALLALLSLGYLTFKNAKVQYRAAIIGFATAAFFTDSFVGVTPIFFALLGNSWRSDDV